MKKFERDVPFKFTVQYFKVLSLSEEHLFFNSRDFKRMLKKKEEERIDREGTNE